MATISPLKELCDDLLEARGYLIQLDAEEEPPTAFVDVLIETLIEARDNMHIETPTRKDLSDDLDCLQARRCHATSVSELLTAVHSTLDRFIDELERIYINK